MRLLRTASATLISAMLLALVSSSAMAGDQPNVVVIITDDAGWADYGFMRNATRPRIRATAALFRHRASTKSPSRASPSPMRTRGRCAVRRGR